MPFALAVGFARGLSIDCSFLEAFLAATGILPDIYRAARPAPGLLGGSRRATTEVERGMIVVSSSYSVGLLVYFTLNRTTIGAHLLCHRNCRSQDQSRCHRRGHS